MSHTHKLNRNSHFMLHNSRNEDRNSHFMLHNTRNEDRNSHFILQNALPPTKKKKEKGLKFPLYVAQYIK